MTSPAPSFDASHSFLGSGPIAKVPIQLSRNNVHMLEPGARFEEPFDYDMSGLVLDPRRRDRAERRLKLGRLL